MSYYKTLSHILINLAGIMNQCAPVLSNIGILNKSLFKFGSVTVTDAYIIPPALCAPGLLLCTGTYNEVLTITASYYETQICREHVEKLLNLLKEKLTEGVFNNSPS